jgi:hypothetical protein
MEAKHTPGHDLAQRIIQTAAQLAERFQNPDVAAYNRSHGGGRHRAGRYIVAPSSKRREHFWFSVGRALGAAYSYRGCPTDYERAVRRDIDAARAAIAKATGEQQ